jgi:hypothetical protein
MNTKIIDIAEFSKENKQIPAGCRYKIKIDREKYIIDQSTIPGKEILELAGKTPYNRWLVNQRLRGGVIKKIGYDEVVDLTTPGIEKFLTLPLDQTEGEDQELIVDLEEYLKENKKIPHGCRYMIKIDREKYVVNQQTITGKELIELAGKTPYDRWVLSQRLNGGAVIKIGYNDIVDLTTPGIEKFMTLPLDQTDGELRKQFSLPEDDIEYLDTIKLPWETFIQGNCKWLIIHDFEIPKGYNHKEAKVAIKIENGYPTAQLDMVYFFPALAKVNNGRINALSNQVIDGLSYQRWSRHRTRQNPWRPGVDDLSAHVTLIESWLERELNPIRHAV